MEPIFLDLYENKPVDAEVSPLKGAGEPLNLNLPPEIPTNEPKFLDLDLGVKESAPPMGTELTVQDVINDEDRMGKIRRMMSKTKDIYYQDAPAEEVMEAFMTHMRYMNTNEVSTIAAAANVFSADEETKAIYGDAFKVYDEMGSMFSNGDAWNGMIDYGGAFLSSPSTYLGFGIGKAAAYGAAKKAGTAFTREAIEAAAKQVAQKSGGKITEKAAAAQIRTEAARTAAKYNVLGALSIEAPIAGIQDYFLQETMLDTGIQDEYSFLQTVAATALGSLGAVPGAYVSITTRGGTANRVAELTSESYKIRAASVARRAAPRIKDSIEKNISEWEKLAEAGKALPENPALYRAVSDWFFDVNDDGGLFGIIREEGANLDVDAPIWTDEIIRYASNMGDEALAEFNKALAPLDINFGRVVEMVASHMRDAGRDFQPASRSKRLYKEFRNLSVTKNQSNKALLENAAEEAPDVKITEKQYLGYTQSLWKKTLVSTLQTTAVNIKGWALARGFQSLSDITHAGSLLGTAGIRAVINPGAGAKDLAKMRSLIANQRFALTTLVDPFMSAKAFKEALESAPKKVQKRISGQLFGGVDQFGPARFGFDPESKGVKAIEKTTDYAQRLSFVLWQDHVTKGISGMIALDKETRLAFGKGFYEMVEAGETYKITADMWDNVGKAVLKETFSEDLTKGRDLFAITASYFEKLSNHPAGGFVVPFGRFINNTAAFIWDYSPAAIALPANNWIRKTDAPLMERTAKAITGTMVAWHLMNEEAQKQEEGLQWFERRRSDGSVEDITNMFPYSAYALIGRIAHNFRTGEGMDKGLIEGLVQQLGPIAAMEDVAGGSVIADITRYMTDETIPEDEKRGVFGTIGSFTLGAAQVGAGIAAGFTRPLSPLNNMISFSHEEAGGGRVADIKQSEGIEAVVLGLSRNTSAFFNFAFGEETEEGVRLFGKPKYSATAPGIARMANPGDAMLGSVVKAPPTAINKVLGEVDRPPYKVDSFSSGVPEYDAFINQYVQPMLEMRAQKLLENPMWQKASQSAKIDMLDKVLNFAEKDVLAMLEGKQVGGMEERISRERANLLVKDRGLRRRAMKALGITTPEHKLSLYEIEAIRRHMDYEEEQFKTLE